MNKHCYCLIFSRTDGELRVVSELTRRHSTAPGQRRRSGTRRVRVTVRRIIWLLGLAIHTAPVVADGIVADSRALSTQRPEVIATQNGLPQVNITAPNQAGISHNHYTQFDVDHRGAILNNSEKMIQTQMAGMIQGNPNLSPDRPTAHVILNEVNSSNPSQLRGFMEVAGNRAQVIVANPSGIMCDGCGTINAGRITLSTGKPQLNADGSLAGYQVERGVVRIVGGGLNDDKRHHTEYVDILARAVQINAAVRTSAEISVVAGHNHISADGKTARALPADGSVTEMAIDMGQMGGMYSGHIRMISTEAGVGVRNQGGHLEAAKTLTVSSDGKIIWQTGATEPVTQAGGNISFTARGDIEHHGRLHSGGAHIAHSREGFFIQSGSLAAAGDVTLTAAGGIESSGKLLAGSDIKSKLIREADLSLNTQGNIRAGGRLLSKKVIGLKGQRIDLNQVTLAAGHLQLDAMSGGVTMQHAVIDSGGFTVNTPGNIEAQQAQVIAENWKIDARNLFTQGGKWTQTGDEESRLSLKGQLDNSDGKIETHRLWLKLASLNNQNGTLTALNNSAAHWHIDGLLNNSNGRLSSNGDLTLNAGDINNLSGRISSLRGLNITSDSDINNTQGALLAGKQLTLNSQGTINNNKGKIKAGLSALDAGETLTIDTKNDRDNRDGTVLEEIHIDVKAAHQNNRQGKRQFQGELKIKSDTLDNTGGTLYSKGAGEYNSTRVINADGWVQAGEALTIDTDNSWDNQNGTVSAGKRIDMKAAHLDNRKGKLLSLGEMKLNTDTLDNTGGTINSRGLADVDTQVFNNQQGVIDGGDALKLAVQRDYTHRAGDTITSNGKVTFTVKGILTNLNDWLLPGSLTVNSDHFTNRGSLGASVLKITTDRLLNTGQLEADRMTLDVDTLDNRDTVMGDDITVHARNIDIHGRDGVIAATKKLSLEAREKLTNRDGSLIYSGGDLYLQSDDLIENSAAVIEAEGNITAKARRFNNLREGLEIEKDAEKENYKWHRYNYYWRSYGSGVNTDIKTMAPVTQNLTFADNAAAQTNPYGTLLAIDKNNKRAQVRVKRTDIWVNYLALKPNADGSYAMTFYETRGDRQGESHFFSGSHFPPTPYHNTVWREFNRGRIEQWDPQKHIDIAEAPHVDDYNNFRERSVTGMLTRDKLVSEGIGARMVAGENITLRISDQILNDGSTIAAKGELNKRDSGSTINRGWSVNERRHEYIEDHYDRDTRHWYPSHRYDKTTALATIDSIVTGNDVTISGTSITNTTANQAQISIKEAQQKREEAAQKERERHPLTESHPSSTGLPQLSEELRLTATQHLNHVATAIPDNALFRQQPSQESRYLVVTDERFTSRSQFISSDYLLQRVGYNPAQIHKRLGDGFYEQRLVREQMLRLTGRSVGGGENAMAHYQTLMNNGVKVAQNVQLVPGVALTPAQIAALQQDIVWMVNETVTTTGGPQTVWVPKVYLAGSTLKLTGNGALIAGGGNLQLSADSIRNAGNLLAGKTLRVDAGQFRHQSGDINAESIQVQADTLAISSNLQDALHQATMSAGNISLGGSDIQLQGAKLNATENISLSASKNLDITAARSSHTASIEVISGAMGNRTSSGMEEAGQRMAQINGEWQQALSSSLNAGGNLNLKAGQDLTLQGSQASADGRTQLQAGGDVRLRAETTTTRTQLNANSSTSSVNNRREAQQLHLATLSGDKGVTIQAGNTVMAEGAQTVSRQGSTTVSGKQIVISSVQQQVNDQDSERKRKGRSKSQREMETSHRSATGSTFSGRDGVTLTSTKGDIAVTGSTLHSGQGSVALQAEKNIQINSATEEQTLYSQQHTEKKGLFKSSSSDTLIKDHNLRQKGSTLSGDSVSIKAGKDLIVSGSDIVADRDVSLQAGNSVDISAASESESHYLLEKQKKSGLLSSGGMGFTLGSQSSRHQVDEKANTQSQSVSTVGSSQGSVNIAANNRVHIGGADLVAGQDLSLTGDSVQIDPGYDQRSRKERTETSQSGFTLSLSGTAGSALNAAVTTAQQAGKERNRRLQALQNSKAVLSGIQAAQALEKDKLISEAAAKNAAAGLKAGDKGEAQGATNTVGLSLSYGRQSSKSETHSESLQAQGSRLTAGNKLTIKADGKKAQPQSGDITVSGSQLKAGAGLSLDASRDITLRSAQSTAHTDSKNRHQSSSIGAGVGVGSGGYSISTSASVSAGKGEEKGQGVTRTSTTLDADRISLSSGRDLTLKGAQAKGDGIRADAGRDLLLQSQQDSTRYDARQQNLSAGGSVTPDSMTGSASISASRDKLHSQYDSVKNQTGLLAGKGGYDIRVQRHSQLDGAVIAGTAGAEKNRLDTGTLGWSDIHNRADFSAEHQSAGFSSGGPIAGNLLSNMNALPLNGEGNSGHAEGDTRAAVSEGELIIRDKTHQQQEVVQLNRDTVHANDGSIRPIFNQEKEQNRLREAQLISDIGVQAGDIARMQGDISGLKAKRDPAALQAAREQLAASGKAFTQADVAQQAYNHASAAYGTGSALQQGIQAATAAVQGLAGGNMVQAAAGAAAPYLAAEIKKHTTDPLTGEVNPAANAMAHAVAGAVTSYAAGNGVLAGAAGAVSGELMAQHIKEQLYPGRKASELTETEKQTLSTLGTLAAGLAGGLAGNRTADAVAGAQAGKNAVENNFLGNTSSAKLDKAVEKISQGDKSLSAANELIKLENADKRSDALVAKFTKNPLQMSSTERAELAGYLRVYASEMEKKYGSAVSQELVKGLLSGQDYIKRNPDSEAMSSAQKIMNTWGYHKSNASIGDTPLIFGGNMLGTTIKEGMALNAAIGTAVNTGAQLSGKDPFSYVDAIVAGVTSALTTGKGIGSSAVINMGGTAVGSAIKGEDPTNAMIGAGVGSVIGDKAGKVVTEQLKPVIKEGSAELIGAATGSTVSEITGGNTQKALENTGNKNEKN